MLFRTGFRGVKVVWIGVSLVSEFSSELDAGQTATDCGSGAQKTAIPPRMCIVIPDKPVTAFVGYNEMGFKAIKLIAYDRYIFFKEKLNVRSFSSNRGSIPD